MPRPRQRTPDHVLRVRELRRNMSVIEKIFWDMSRRGQLGFSFRRQHPMFDVTVDFYCAEARLAVEFDGEQHDLIQDRERDLMLQKHGIDTIRVPNRNYFM